MPLETFIPIYGHLCTALEVVVPGGNPRSRGFPPKLSDAQALTMEFVGAFLGYHGDQAIGEDWRRHGATGFPHLGDRSTFVRQLANLGQIKALLHQHWAGTLGAFEAPVHLVDGFPVPVCHPKRVSRHTVFRGEADWGFCASKDPYGMTSASTPCCSRRRKASLRASPRPRPGLMNAIPSSTCPWSEFAGPCSATRASYVPS